MQVGFIGLGRMGCGMAANLLAAGHQVAAHNRTPGKAQELVAKGARQADTVADACRGDAVITMLANDESVEAAVFGEGGILASLPSGALHVCSATIGVELSKRLAEEHAKARQRYVAAPVFGRPEAAAAAQLFIIAAGEPDAIDAAQPLFSAMGQRTFVASNAPQAANLIKLCGNFLIAAVIESLGEALALATKGGVDPRHCLDVLTATVFNVPTYKTYGGLIVNGQFDPPAFAAPLGQKDIRLVLAAAEALSVPLPIASLLRDRFLALHARGSAHLDWSAIGSLAAADAGLPAGSMRGDAPGMV